MKIIEHTDFITKQTIHCVEYSTYEQLQAQCEKLAEALEKSCWCGYYSVIDRPCEGCKILKEYEEFKKGEV